MPCSVRPAEVGGCTWTARESTTCPPPAHRLRPRRPLPVGLLSRRRWPRPTVTSTVPRLTRSSHDRPNPPGAGAGRCRRLDRRISGRGLGRDRGSAVRLPTASAHLHRRRRWAAAGGHRRRRPVAARGRRAGPRGGEPRRPHGRDGSGAGDHHRGHRPTRRRTSDPTIARGADARRGQPGPGRRPAGAAGLGVLGGDPTRPLPGHRGAHRLGDRCGDGRAADPGGHRWHREQCARAGGGVRGGVAQKGGARRLACVE